MRGLLTNLYRAQFVEGPSGPRPNVSGKLGVFDYDGSEKHGNLCLFQPDDSEDFGRVKMRTSPGIALRDGDLLRFAVKYDGSTYAWRIVDEIMDETELQEFREFAEAHDNIIRRLLEAARLLDE